MAQHRQYSCASDVRVARVEKYIIPFLFPSPDTCVRDSDDHVHAGIHVDDNPIYVGLHIDEDRSDAGVQACDAQGHPDRDACDTRSDTDPSAVESNVHADPGTRAPTSTQAPELTAVPQTPAREPATTLTITVTQGHERGSPPAGDKSQPLRKVGHCEPQVRH